MSSSKQLPVWLEKAKKIRDRKGWLPPREIARKVRIGDIRLLEPSEEIHESRRLVCVLDLVETSCKSRNPSDHADFSLDRSPSLVRGADLYAAARHASLPSGTRNGPKRSAASDSDPANQLWRRMIVRQAKSFGRRFPRE